MSSTNALGQPIGFPLSGWTPPPVPARTAIGGRYCRLEPMHERFALELHAAAAHDRDGRTWTYLPYGPFASEDECRRWLIRDCLGDDPAFFVIVDAATEAMYLMMRRAFEAGFRRYEWKCDALNAPSRAAAERLGFTYEGIFRQATVVKGRNRDTAWYAAIDSEWPRLRAAFEAWLVPDNFDASGRQRRRLESFR